MTLRNTETINIRLEVLISVDASLSLLSAKFRRTGSFFVLLIYQFSKILMFKIKQQIHGMYFFSEGAVKAIVVILLQMQQIIAARCTTTVGNHLRRTLLVATPSRDGTIIKRRSIMISNAAILQAHVITVLVYAIKLLLNASIAIEIQATIRTSTIGKVYAPKRLRRLKWILIGVHLCGMSVRNIQLVAP